MVATGMSQASFESWVSDKLDEWAQDLGQPLDHLLNSAGVGTTISGFLMLGSEFAQNCRNFVSWLRNDMSLQDNSTEVVIQGGLTLDGYPAAQGPITFDTSNSNDSAAYPGTTTIPMVFGNQEHGAIYYVWFRLQPGASLSGYYHFSFEIISTEPGWINVMVGGQNHSRNLDSNFLVNGYYAYSSGYIFDTYYCFPYSLLNDISAAELAQQLQSGDITSGAGLSVDTGTITLPTIATGQQVYIDTGALPGDTVDVITQGVITQVITGNPPIEGGDVAEEEPPLVITGPVEIPGLAQVFPFCLPFDVYNFLSALAADPEAPHFEWRFYVPGICDETLEIDLSAFNTVAQILRTMELLAFIVGLAFVTRSRFIRS